jgi:hypothetical protein
MKQLQHTASCFKCGEQITFSTNANEAQGRQHQETVTCPHCKYTNIFVVTVVITNQDVVR